MNSKHHYIACLRHSVWINRFCSGDSRHRLPTWRAFGTVCILFLCYSTTFAQSSQTRSFILTYLAAQPARNDFAILTAKIRTNTDTANAYRHLDTLLATGYGDMFWMYGCAGLYYACTDQLRPEYKAKIRDAWKHRTPYRGDTENHFLMYYGSLLLMSQAWPDLPDSEWFMGKSSREIYAESVEYLDHWIDETVREGTTEWSSPRYAYYYITPLLLLSEYTKNARLKHRFEMMLEYMLADYASDYLNGSYCGAHSRVGDEEALNPRSAEINAYGQYFFEDSVTHILPDLAFASMTRFVCPKIIREIAHDRSQPYEQYSLKRGRQMIRYLDKWSAYDSTHDSTFHAPVYKYEYMTKDYCLGSMQGGIVQPIQQQSWSLVFNSDKPNNVITGLHPYVSADELGMFFPEYPSYQLESISKVKKGYTSEDKWVGGSPYERIYQRKNVLVAQYHFPDSVKYRHVNLYIPPSFNPIHLIDQVQDPHWIWGDIDSTAIEIYVFGNARYIAGYGYRITPDSTQPDRCGYAVFCSYYRTSGEQLPSTKLSLTIKNGRIKSVEDHAKAVNLKLDRLKDPSLFHSPFLTSKSNSAVLTVKHGANKLVLDFRK